MKKRVAGLLVAASIGAVPALPAGAAAPSICGTTLTGDVTLTSDLACNLLIEEDDVRLDLAGHHIEGRVLIESRDESIEVTGVEVVDGSVRDLDIRYAGVTLEDLVVGELFPTGAALTARRVDAHLDMGSGFGAGEIAFHDGRVRSFTDCTQCGDITITGSRVDVALEGSGTFDLRGNDLSGVQLGWGSRLHMEGNRGGDLQLDEVRSATVIANSGRGAVEISSAAGPVRLERNVFASTQIDLSVAPPTGAGVVVDGNWFLGGSSSGLQVTGAHAGRVEVRDNVAAGNWEYGIHAPGVVDGGGNRASGNWLDPDMDGEQCVGVVCAPK